MPTTALAEVEMEVLPPQVEPSWDRARELIREIGDWQKIIELGRILQALYRQYFNQGGDTRFGSSARGRTERSLEKPTKEGWQAVVRRELGMTHQAALRAIDRGLQVEKVAAVIEMEEVEYQDTKGQVHKFRPTESMRERARDVIVEIVSGANAGRAWAGLIGEETRRGRKGTPDRAPVDHFRNLSTALTKLENSLKAWGKIKPAERAKIEEQWERVAALIPATWSR